MRHNALRRLRHARLRLIARMRSQTVRMPMHEQLLHVPIAMRARPAHASTRMLAACPARVTLFFQPYATHCIITLSWDLTTCPPTACHAKNC